MMVAERLRMKLVTERAKTITQVAKELGMSRPAFSNVVNGTAELSIDLAIKIEAVFGINAERLLMDQLKEKIDEAHQRP